MAITRYTEGGVTITLDGALEDLVRRALEAAGGETLRLMEAAAEEIAAKGRAEWYAPGSGVTKKTGKSGDIQVVTTASENEVRVSVGSTDTGKIGNKPRAVLIHRRGRLSLEPKLVSRAEWWAWKKAGKPVGKAGTTGDSWTIHVPSDKASDGKFLVAELIRKPMRAKVKAITPELAKAIATKISGGA
jgi:hypothetical protein